MPQQVCCPFISLRSGVDSERLVTEGPRTGAVIDGNDIGNDVRSCDAVYDGNSMPIEICQALTISEQ
jgi:hypothetical protein